MKCEKEHHARGYCKQHYEHFWKYGKILKRTRNDLNQIIKYKNYYKIILYNRKHKEVARTLIDKEDYEKVKDYKWHLDNNNYARTTNNKIHKIFKLHCFILGKIKRGFVVDHINHNTLDNRKCNLRVVTQSQNIMNSQDVRGYYWDKNYKSWYTKICVKGKSIFLGYFKNKLDAIKARKEAEIKYFGVYRYKGR